MITGFPNRFIKQLHDSIRCVRYYGHILIYIYVRHIEGWERTQELIQHLPIYSPSISMRVAARVSNRPELKQWQIRVSAVAEGCGGDKVWWMQRISYTKERWLLTPEPI